MNFFKKIFSKTQPQQINKDVPETYVDVLLSLNKNFEVDLSLFIDCNYKKNNIDLIDYVIVCAKFLNFDTNKMKQQMIEILNNQIKNSENELLINSLVSILKNENSLDTESELDNFYIKPSQVFIKHIHEHK